MKIFLIIFLSLVSSWCGFGQERKTVDSLLTLALSKQDTALTRVYIRLAHEYNSVNWDTSLMYASTAVELAKNQAGSELEMLALNARGYVLMNRNKIDSALTDFNKSLKINEKIANSSEQAVMLNNVGICLYRMGLRDSSLQQFATSLKIRQVNYETAKQKSDVKQLTFMVSDIANSHLNIGTISFQMGRGDTAEYYLNQALLYQQEAAQLCVEHGFTDRLHFAKEQIAYVYNMQAYILGKHAKIDEALEYHYKALAMREEIDDKIGVANSLHNIAYILVDQDQLSESLEIYDKCIEFRKSAGDPLGLSTAYQNKGKILELLDKDYQAEECFYLALAIRDSLHAHDKSAVTLLSLGELKQKQDSLLVAQLFFKRGIAIVDSIGSEERKADGYILLGNNEWKLGNHQNAFMYANKSLELSKPMGLVTVISRGYELLYNLYKEGKSHQNALEFYELHIQMRDSINNDKTQKATIRQQTKYEFEKAQLVKEQELTEENRKLKEQTQRRDNLQYSVILIVIVVLLSLLFTLGKFKISPFVVEGLIFFVFLLLFEFLLVLADPYVDNWTGGEPMYKLLLNALLAGLIFPVHAFFERVLKKRLVR